MEFETCDKTAVPGIPVHRRDEQYAEMIKTLKSGKVVKLSVPAGADANRFRANVYNALRYRGVQAQGQIQTRIRENSVWIFFTDNP